MIDYSHKMFSEHFRPCSWYFLHPLSEFPPLPCHDPTLESISLLFKCYVQPCSSASNCVFSSPFQCRGPTQAHACSPHEHHSSTSDCSLLCWKYHDKRQSLVTILQQMYLGRQSSRQERYLCSTANTDSGAQLLINLNHCHIEKPLYSTVTNYFMNAHC